MMKKVRRLFIDLILSGLIGAVMGSMIGAIGFFIPWLSERQREALPVAIIIGFLLGIASVFVRGRPQITNKDK
jgi:hypothetical protein